MMFIAAILYAGYTIGLRERPRVSGLSLLAGMAVAAFVTSVPLMIWEVASGGFIWPTAAGFATLVYVALGPAFVSQIFFMRGVELIGPGRAGVFVNLVPVFGAIMAVVLLGEPFAAYHVVALIAGRRRDRHCAKRLERRSALNAVAKEEIDMAWIELKPEGAGPIRAWRADPHGHPRGGVVVIQEIFGVNAHIREVTDRFAAEGYLAVAPAIFEHAEKGFDVGYDPESRARGMAVVGKPDFEQTLRDVAAAIEVAKEGGKVGIVGFCFGGSVAWAAAGAPAGPERRGRLLRRAIIASRI